MTERNEAGWAKSNRGGTPGPCAVKGCWKRNWDLPLGTARQHGGFTGSAEFPVCCVADFQVGTGLIGCGFGNPRHGRLGGLRYKGC